MINHQSLPSRSEPFPKVNVISSQTHGLGWEPRYGHSCGCGRNSQYHSSHGSNSSNSQKKKASLYHKSEVILRQNKKIGSVYKINFLRTMRTIVIDMVWKGIGCVLVVHPNIWLTFTKHQWK